MVGQLAYTKLCGGDHNIAIGEYSGYCNCGGSRNVYLGNSVAYHGTGNFDNILIGSHAANNGGSSGYMCCTSHNIGMGYYVLYSLQCGGITRFGNLFLSAVFHITFCATPPEYEMEAL